MADEVLEVQITKLRGDPTRCKARPDFAAKRGSFVTFVFTSEPAADIVFDGDSPFDSKKFKPGRMKTRSDAPNKEFSYSISWIGGAGQGNGTGEIIP